MREHLKSGAMGCLLGCGAFFFPRFVIVLLVIFSNYLGNAYETLIWPILGFLFLPTTTIAYAFAINSAGSVQGIYLFLVLLAFLLDLGLVGGSGEGYRRHRSARP